MSDSSPAVQGFARDARERLPMIAFEQMSDAQRAAAQALIDGPRKGVYGPFLPLLRSPELLDRMAKVGEYLRFGSTLGERVRELATCAAARHVSNQFEWRMHEPLARKAGVAEATLQALRTGAQPRHLPPDEEAALDVAFELLRNHGVCDATWNAALAQFGEQGAVELVSLVGYFVMVSWLMNVARTPPLASAQGEPLDAFPL
jgi:4-carboxymuconolactone decarboxylase